ncbi:MAG TPA: hypothetical protein VGJ12_05950 [Gemmatimonadaceae bacterium]|jgi:hypothetical protein
MLVLVAVAPLVMACNDTATTGSSAPPFGRTVVSVSGNITDAVTTFRTLLGAPNGAVAGEQAAGRREINWDGAAANVFDNTNAFPADFFNTVAKVGAVFTTDGSGFRNDSTLFVDINPAYADQFQAFSPNKIFAPIGSNLLDVLFQVAGQPTPAVSSGFGIVFSDVDVANATTIELFAQDGSSLGVVAAPVRTDAAGFSFVGVSFNQPVIARVRVTLGTGALASDVNDISAGGVKDLVVLDNLIYGEPKKAF